MCLSEIMQLFYVFVLLRAIYVLRTARTRTWRSRQLQCPVPSMYSRTCSRARAGRLRPDCAARAAHTDPITSAHCPNEVLYQFGVQSVQPSGDNAGSVVLRARLRAQLAHQCATTITGPITSAHCSNECVPIWVPIGPAVWPPMLDRRPP
jgi:hypothetical protein